MKSHTTTIAGFTLMEVMVALVILAFAMTGAIKVATTSTKNATYLRDRTLAHWVAMNQAAMTELEPPDEIATTGTELMGNHEWFWKRKVSNTPDSNVQKVEISVAKSAINDEIISKLTLYINRSSEPQS